MVVNKFYISMYQLGYLEGVNDILNADLFLKRRHLKKVNCPTIFFNSLIQSGSQEILLGCQKGKLPKEFDLPPNLTSRIKIINDIEAYKNEEKIKHFLIENINSRVIIRNKKNIEYIERISRDIGSLIFCASGNLSFVSPTIMRNDLSNIRRFFNLQTSVPLENFLRKIHSSNICSNEFTHNIGERDIKIIEEILESNLYLKIKDEYIALKSSNQNLDNHIKIINYLSKKLRNTYDTKLKIKNNILNTLDFGSNFMSLFGNLGKSISDSIFSQIKRASDKDKRVIVYNSNKFFDWLVKERLEHLTVDISKNLNK